MATLRGGPNHRNCELCKLRGSEGGPTHYVYILRSKVHPAQTYIGSTSDLKKRLADHNSGKSIHTNKFKPWELEAYVAFPHEELAHNFEKYLKTGSGRAFTARHLRKGGI